MRPLVIALGLFAAASATHAQSTAFTYQGQLNDNGSPASGLHDFRFKLFDAASGGSQVGATQCLDNLLVTDGRFTATIDFGNQFITPGSRFIEIDVRRDTGLNCANSSGFATLSSRQLITATPLATHAKSAFSLDAPNGSIANAVFVDNGGRVGIGTTSPTHSLHIAGIEPTIALQDTNSTTDQVGYISYRDSGSVERAWIGYGSPGDPHLTMLNARPAGDVVLNSFLGGLQFLTSGSNRMNIDTFGNIDMGTVRVAQNGNVGLGTSFPLAKLDVRGDIRLGSAGQSFAVAGDDTYRIFRGRVAANGVAAIGGAYFTSTRISQGHYAVTFTTPFAGTPTVIPTIRAGIAADGFTVTVFGQGEPTSSTVQFNVHYAFDGSWSDRDIDFIVMGPR